MRSLMCLLSVLAAVVVIGVTASPYATEKEFVRNVLETYGDVRGRPVSNSSTAVDVDVAFALAQVLAFDQMHQHLTLAAWITLRWEDEFLQWEDGPAAVVLEPKDLWTPKLVIVNAVNAPEMIDSGELRVTSEGAVTWASQQRLQVSCETNPEDAEPSCFVRFSSWTLPASKLRLTARKGRVNAGFYTAHHDWELSKTKAVVSDRNMNFPCCPDESFIIVDFHISLKRRPKVDDEKDKKLENGSPALSLSILSALLVLVVML